MISWGEIVWTVLDNSEGFFEENGVMHWPLYHQNDLMCCFMKLLGLHSVGGRDP